jgi:amino acid permease
MILSDTIPQLAQAFLGVTLTRTQALIGVTCLALLPLCLSKELSKLAPFSLVGIIGMMYTVVAMAIRYFQGSYQLPHGNFLPHIETQPPCFGTQDSVWNPNAFLFLSMISTAFMAHYNAPKFYFELRNHTLPRYYTVVSTSFGIAICLFVAVAALGFLTFGQASKGLVLHNYATQDGLMSVSRIAVAISILFS